MVAKKKALKHKKVKQDKAKLTSLANMSEEAARRYLEGMIAKGSPREAIQALQQSHLAGSPAFEILLVRAQAARARQLKEKGLDQESAVLLDMVSSQLAKVDSSRCGEIAGVIAEAPLDFGMHYYEQHQRLHAGCPQIEQALADQLVLSNGWEILGTLPDEHALKKDGLVMAEAMPYFDAALWQEGLAKLDSLSRKSLFAPWKLFAKAMASAYKGEEEDLQRALKQIPQSFPLGSTVQLLREKGSEGLETLQKAVRRPYEEMAQDLVKAIQKKDRLLPQLITQFAHKLFPQNPGMAVRSVSETVAFALMTKDVGHERIEKLLPKDFLKPIIMRLQMFSATETGAGVFPFCLALSYMKHFDIEAPYVGDRSKVEAAVYFFLLGKAMVLRKSSRPHSSHDHSCLLQWIEKPNLTMEDAYLAAVDKITRMVPDVDIYYKIVKDLSLSSLSSQGKGFLERTLNRMQKQFPEDPFSYLHLARLHRSKGAYRKSQKVLEEAWKQAPYDPQVRELYGLGLLKASIMGRKRKSFAVAHKDLEEAVNLDVKSLLPLIHAVRATLTFVEKPSADPAGAALGSLIELPDPVLRFRSLMCFYQDLTKEYAESMAGKFAEQVRKRARKDLKSALGELSDSDLTGIIAPFPEDFADLIGQFDDLEFFGDLWAQILATFDDQHVLNVYTRLLSHKGDFVHIKWVQKDLKKRLKGKPGSMFLQFFSVLADYVLDPGEESEGFERLLSKLNNEDRQKLKDFCRKIASHFDEPLSNALGSFHFEMLEEEDFWLEPDFFDDEDWDDEDFDEEEEDSVLADLFGRNPGEIIIEGLNRMGGNKGMLQIIFEMLLTEVKASRLDDESLREMGRTMERTGKEMVNALRQAYRGKKGKSLGREGRLLLFPDEK